MKVGATISRLPNVDTKMVTQEETTKELHNERMPRRTTIITLKGKDLKVFATIAGEKATCPGIVGPRKKLFKVTWQHPKRR